MTTADSGSLAAEDAPSSSDEEEEEEEASLAFDFFILLGLDLCFFED